MFPRLTAIFAQLPEYQFEHLLIDNASTDSTVEVIKSIIATAPRVGTPEGIMSRSVIRSYDPSSQERSGSGATQTAPTSAKHPARGTVDKGLGSAASLHLPTNLVF